MRFTVDDPIALEPAEELVASGMGKTRRAYFAAGRCCARVALERLGTTGPVLTRADGAPLWPRGLRGSISHKEGIAVALVGSADVVGGLGVDLELAKPLPAAVWVPVLTRTERGPLAAVGHDSDLSGRLAFSAKEAYYKWFRSAGRAELVGFQDLSIRPEGGALRFQSEVPGRFPEPHGAFGRTGSWLVTVVWSGVGTRGTPARGAEFPTAWS